MLTRPRTDNDAPLPPRRRFPVHRDPVAWALATVTLLLGGVFVLVDLAYNQGELVAPLDDVYIHLQYAAQLGTGHFLHYQTGDPVTTGASSLLYVLVLGAAYAAGVDGPLLLPFAVGFGIACLAATVVLVYRLGCVLVDRTVGIWTGVLVAFSGPLLWGAASGMEIGLTALLLVATLLAFTRERGTGRFVGTPLLGALLALARPEGLIFTVPLCGAMLWTVASARRADRVTTLRAIGRVVLSLLPIAAGVGQRLYYFAATGTASATGIQVKSYLYDQPQFFLGGVADRTLATLRGLVDALNGLNHQSFVFPAALPLCVVGLVYLLVTRRRWRALVVTTGLGLGLVLVAVSTLKSALVQELRYIQPFLPVILLLAVCGIHAVTRLLANGRRQRVALHTALVIALLFTLLALPDWVVKFGRQTATIRTTDIAAAAWIRQNLPPDAVVAVKDVGAVTYLGDHQVIDLIGLTTRGLAEPSNNGIGALYEVLVHMRPERRPDFFAVYNEKPGPPMQPLIAAGIVDDEPLVTFEPHRPQQLTGASVVPFEQLRIYRADWALAGSGDRPPANSGLADITGYLDVGNPASERAHGYHARMARPALQPRTVLRRQGDVVDSGRVIVGGERFTVHGLEAGQPLTIGSRIVAAEDAERKLRVRVDGQPIGVWRLPFSGRGWTTATFTVPGSAISSPSVTVELEPVRPLLGPYPEYTSFGYWFAS